MGSQIRRDHGAAQGRLGPGMKSVVHTKEESGNRGTLNGTSGDLIDVRLFIEPNVLSTALQQILSSNPDLRVEVCPQARSSGADAGVTHLDGTTRIVRITLLENPFRFQLESDGREWIVDYCGLSDLARQLSDLDNWRAAFGWLTGRPAHQLP